MAQQLIAIDLSPGAARVVFIEATLRRAQLSGVKTIPLGSEVGPDGLWAHLRAHLPGPIDSVIVGVDPRTTSTRALEFPFGDTRKAESAALFELEGQIPYAIEDVATTWHITDRSAQRCALLAAICPKAPLAQFLAGLSAAGLEPRAAVLPGAALAEFVAAEQATPTAIVAVGASQTHLAVTRQGLRLVRSLRAGGDDVDRAVARAFDVPLAQARQAKEAEARLLAPDAPASEAERRLSDAVAAGLTPLVGSLVATFKSLPADDMPQRLCLTGGLSRLPGLPEHLSQRLGIAVELLDIRAATQSLPGGPEAVGPEYAVALGLAVALFRHGHDVPLNFRRGELAYHGDIALYRGQLTRLAVGVVAVLSLAIMASVVRFSLLVAEGRELNRAFCQTTQAIVGREICDPAAALSALRAEPGAEGVVIPSYSAAALLEMMSKAVSNDVDVQFDELDLHVDAVPGQAERLTAKGEAATFETLEQLTAMLKRDVCVQEVEISKQRRTQSTARVEFNVAVKVACPVGIGPGTQQAPPPATASAAPAPAPAP